MSLRTTFFATTPAFSSSAQLNLGPFFVGFVNKFFRVQVRGALNYQGATAGTSSVLANFPAWGVQQVPHTAAAEDVITSIDNDVWFIRRQTATGDLAVAWAPSTSVAGLITANVLNDDWRGQLAVGGDTDLWFSLKTSNGVVLPNANVFVTIRLWWS